jgi:serine/threonine protein kinase
MIKIGEGGFGCVHRPSLKCKDKPKMNYKNKTSKILLKSEALKELNEYKELQKIDKSGEFYLGVPEKCAPDGSLASNNDAFKMCEMSNIYLMNETDLFIMQDGGQNMSQYIFEMRHWDLSKPNLKKCELFLLETLRLFRGVLTFNENGLVHFDLKPQNIVYNEETNRLNFIDFGLMRKKEKLLKTSKNSSFSKRFWFNYPWEIEYLNRSKFLKLKNKMNEHKAILEYTNKITLMTKEGTHEYKHVNTFMKYILETKQKKYNDLLNLYKHFYTNDLKDQNFTYDIFSKKLVDTIDSYGLGFTLLYWLRISARFFLLLGDKYKTMINDLEICFTQMIHPWQSVRSEIGEAIFDFEEILKDSGILEKHNKQIVNHVLVSENTSVYKKDIKVEVDVPKNFKIDDKLVNLEPNDCPDGKERNPKTNRCVNICKEHYYRNPDFKCVSSKKEEENRIKQEQFIAKRIEQQQRFLEFRIKREQKAEEIRIKREQKAEQAHIKREQKAEQAHIKREQKALETRKKRENKANKTRRAKTNSL